METETPAPFESRQKVYFDMLDLLGVLHNAAYIVLFERARTEFWRNLYAGRLAEGFDWPYLVVRNEINYRAPIATEQEVRVTVSIAALGRSSITFAQEIYAADGTLAADGQTVIARIDAETRRATPWSDAFRALVAPYVFPR